MTFADRVHALAAFGWTPRQCAFLVTVALHGGYCLQRHYTAFAGIAHGQMVRDFFDGLVARALATPVVFQPNRGRVYHLHAKSLYRALDQADNRNRRPTTPLQIARKLMLLDYVVATPAHEWLATEQDKVAFFTTRCGVALAELPQRAFASGVRGRVPTTRYFIDKWPIAVASAAAEIRFAYLVHDTTGAGFHRFLHDHLGLISRLPLWVIVAVCPRHIEGWAACQRVFTALLAAPPPHVTGVDLAEVRWFFRARQAVERGDLRGLSVEDLNRFRESRPRLTTEPIERLYAAWQRTGEAVLAEADTPRVVPTASLERLMTYTVPFQYPQFGTRPGVA